jgi:hypothetical protein
MDSLLAITVVCIIFAVGDLVSAKTKAIFSMLFTSSVILLVGFWMGLPKTIFEDAALVKIGVILIALLITHMGTLMSVAELMKQWKTVIIALGAVVGIGVFMFLVGSPVLGREYAVAAAPPIAGGVVAAIIMGEAAKAKGLETIVVFTTLLVVVQGFFGYPVASVMLRKEAERLAGLFRGNKLGKVGDAAAEIASASDDQGAAKPKKKLLPPLPKELQTPYILLAKLGVVAIIGFKLAALTNGAVNKYVMCLLVGIAFREIGFLEESIMTKANAFGLGMVALMAVIFANLVKATPQMILSLLWPLVCSLVLGLIGIVLSSWILGKLLGYSKEMSIAIGSSALFGFPGTFVISNEVANAVGRTEEEKQAILNEILPKMLVAGFTTVTITSVILAGFMAKLI